MKNMSLACLIDDDPIHIFVTKEEIEKTQLYESIITFKNGKEAYDELKKIFLANGSLPDIILLDLNMPIWDGWDFLDEFTKLPIEKQITIFIISSSNDPADLKKSKKYNAVKNLVVKPITGNKLISELKTI